MTRAGAPYAFALLDIRDEHNLVPALIMTIGMPRQMPTAQALSRILSDIGWIQPRELTNISSVLAGTPVAGVEITGSGLEVRTHTEVNAGLVHSGPVHADESRHHGLSTQWWEAVTHRHNRCLAVLVDVMNLRHVRRPIRRLDAAARRGALLMGSALVHTTPLPVRGTN